MTLAKSFPPATDFTPACFKVQLQACAVSIYEGVADSVMSNQTESAYLSSAKAAPPEQVRTKCVTAVLYMSLSML